MYTPYQPDSQNSFSSQSTQSSNIGAPPSSQDQNIKLSSAFNLLKITKNTPIRKQKRKPKINPVKLRPLEFYFNRLPNYSRDQTILALPTHLFRQQAIAFRTQHELCFPSALYLGTYGPCCYYSNSDYLDYIAYCIMPVFFGIKAGELEVDNDGFICNIDVETNLQKHGIGTQLVSLANRYKRLLVLAAPLNSYRYIQPAQRELTAEGMRLMESCIRNKILKRDQLVTPDDY